MKLTKIVIYSRGKYRDEDGNPYLAYIAFLHFQHKSYFDKMIIYKSMTWGSCGEHDCLIEALEGINEALRKRGKKGCIKSNDKRIEHHWMHVYRYDNLRNPLRWKEHENE